MVIITGFYINLPIGCLALLALFLLRMPDGRSQNVLNLDLRTTL